MFALVLEKIALWLWARHLLSLFYTCETEIHWDSRDPAALEVCVFQGGHCSILLDTDVWDWSQTIMGSTLWSTGVITSFQPDSHEEFHWKNWYFMRSLDPQPLGDNSLPAVNYLCSPRPAASLVSPFCLMKLPHHCCFPTLISLPGYLLDTGLSCH